jgi:glycosyltransferase involved in cell wall biosynthesis
MRIALCSDACDVGGAERYLLELAEDLAGTHDVHVVLSDCQSRGVLEGKFLACGVSDVHHLPSGIYPHRNALRIYRRAREFFAGSGADVIHFSLHHADSCRYWMRAAAHLGVSYVITEHAVSPGFLHASRLTLRMKRHAYEHASHVVFVSESGRREIETQLGVLPKASVIHPGVAAEVVRSPGNNRVVFIGRWDAGKDPVTAALAFIEASQDVPDTTLSVFGAGPMEPELIRISVEAPPGRIHLLGWSSDPSGDTQKAGVFLMTSRWENSPYAILDAMASGLTVVAYAVGDVASMLDFGNAGLPVQANDFDGLVQALRLAMTDEVVRSQFADLAPKRVRSAYSRVEMVSRTVAVYRDAVV